VYYSTSEFRPFVGFILEKRANAHIERALQVKRPFDTATPRLTVFR